MGEWEPVKTQRYAANGTPHTVYYWVVPANVTGTWEWNMPAGTDKKCYVLRLNQHFTQVNGIVTEGALNIPIKDAKLSGDRFQFTLEQMVKGQIVTMRFEGRV